MSKVKIAVIPAGGRGTRFLPTTKSIPKELLPLGRKPIILHVVEELVNAGIENIIFTVAHHKDALEKFFTPNEELVRYYLSLGKKDEVKDLRRIEKMAKFTFVHSLPPYGNGTTLNDVRHLVGDEPFIITWADEIIMTKGKSRIQQCLKVFDKYKCPVISAIEIKDQKKRCLYGMAELRKFGRDETVRELVSIYEKPKCGTEPSIFAAHGAYILTSEIFKYLDKTRPDKNGELWLSDVINKMNKEKRVLAKIIKNGDYFDCGNPVAYMMAQLNYGVKYCKDKRAIRKLIEENQKMW